MSYKKNKMRLTDALYRGMMQSLKCFGRSAGHARDAPSSRELLWADAGQDASRSSCAVRKKVDSWNGLSQKTRKSCST